MRYSSLFVVIAMLLSTNAFSADLEARAVIRNKKHKAKERTVTLEGLSNTSAFEGPDFKIVVGRSNQALSTECKNKKLCLKAATAWYHLTKSKQYFLNTLQSDYVASLPQIVVRIDMDAQFNAVGHFGNPNLSKEFNNAVSVPGGKARPAYDIEAWGPEIWVRPGKEVKVEAGNSSVTLSLRQMLKEFRKQMRVVSFQRFLVETISLIGNFTGAAMLESSVRFGGTLAVLELAYGGFNLVTRLFNKTKVYLDTALVPEIVAHEFSHIALSDEMALSRSAAVNEGMADYFAIRIHKNDEIAKRARKYARIKGKDANNDLAYNVAFETGAYANVDFVLGLLYETGKVVGSEQDQFIYNLRKKTNTNSTIRNDLVKNILELCREQCPSPRVDRLRLLQMFHDKGL